MERAGLVLSQSRRQLIFETRRTKSTYGRRSSRIDARLLAKVACQSARRRPPLSSWSSQTADASELIVGTQADSITGQLAAPAAGAATAVAATSATTATVIENSADTSRCLRSDVWRQAVRHCHRGERVLWAALLAARIFCRQHIVCSLSADDRRQIGFPLLLQLLFRRRNTTGEMATKQSIQ